jgi:hypothetical protein
MLKHRKRGMLHYVNAMSKEAKAPIKINDLLKEAGWKFFDDAEGKANIRKMSRRRRSVRRSPP